MEKVKQKLSPAIVVVILIVVLAVVALIGWQILGAEKGEKEDALPSQGQPQEMEQGMQQMEEELQQAEQRRLQGQALLKANMQVDALFDKYGSGRIPRFEVDELFATLPTIFEVEKVRDRMIAKARKISPSLADRVRKLIGGSATYQAHRQESSIRKAHRYAGMRLAELGG